MILHGNQRGGGRDLALHLLKDENDDVEIHEISGFVSNDLQGAFDEAYAISKCTKAKQYLYSLSLNPPPDAKVKTDDFIKAIDEVETSLNLKGQPRAIVFHIKQSRRHCHVVWSRTDIAKNKAIPLPHTKRKLMEISRDLFVKHGWQMPQGMLQKDLINPLNFTMQQWQQAKRIGKDPRAIKADLQDCWSISDNKDALAQALKSYGYILAKGDRRNFVVVDHRCEIYALPKWLGLKTKLVKNTLGNSDNLPSVEEAKKQISSGMLKKLTDIEKTQNKKITERQKKLVTKLDEIKQTHLKARQELICRQKQEAINALNKRAKRFRQGLMGIWDRVTGKHKKIRLMNEKETRIEQQRHTKEKDALLNQQLEKQQNLIKRHNRLEIFKEKNTNSLSTDKAQYQSIYMERQDKYSAETKHQPNSILNR